MFKIMTSSLDKRKKPTESEINKIPSYIFCRWLSGSPHCIFAANQINYYHNIPVIQQYQMIKNSFAGKIKYIPYPKNESSNKSTDINIISEHFKINMNNAQEYLELMSKDELNFIRSIYKT